MDITVRLKGGEESVEALLAGPLISRFWLTEVEGEPGVYTLHAGMYPDAEERPGAESAYALLHYLSSGTELAEDAPPLPELTPTAREQRDRWRAFMESLGDGEAPR